MENFLEGGLESGKNGFGVDRRSVRRAAPIVPSSPLIRIRDVVFDANLLVRRQITVRRRGGAFLLLDGSVRCHNNRKGSMGAVFSPSAGWKPPIALTSSKKTQRSQAAEWGIQVFM